MKIFKNFISYFLVFTGLIIAFFGIGSTLYEVWKGSDGLVYKIPDNVSLPLLWIMFAGAGCFGIGMWGIFKTEPKIWAK